MIILFLAFFSLFSRSLAQSDECAIGIDSAAADFSKGVLRIFIFGRTDSFTFGKLINEELGVETVYSGPFVERKWECYSEFMLRQIKAKFGPDRVENLWQKAERLDSAGKGDRMSEFPGGEDGLMRFICSHLDLQKANYSPGKESRVFLQFTIDTTGRPVDIKVLKSSNDDYSKEAIRVLNLMPNWLTTTRDGRPVPQKWNLPILFDDVWRRENCP